MLIDGLHASVFWNGFNISEHSYSKIGAKAFIEIYVDVKYYRAVLFPLVQNKEIFLLLVMNTQDLSNI